MFSWKSVYSFNILIAALAISSAALANNSQPGPQDFQPIPLKAGACDFKLTDKSDGLVFESSHLNPAVGQTVFSNGTPFLELTQNNLGSDDSTIFVMVDPYLDQNDNFGITIHVDREHHAGPNDPAPLTTDTVEIDGTQISTTAVQFDVSESALANGQYSADQSRATGTYVNGKMTVNETTEDLQVYLSCQF